MKFAVLDFETTGSGQTDEIIQVGLVIINDFQITDRYTSLVDPGIRIPSSITALTGITDDMVKDAPSLHQVITEMQPLLADAVLVAHNVAFDFGFLQRALARTGYRPFGGRVLDTLEALRFLFPSLASLQLSMVADAFGVAHERPHQADSDAEVTAEIWLICLHKLLSLPLLTVQRLSYLFQAYPSSDIGWLLQEVAAFKEQQTGIDMDADRYFRQFTLAVDNWDTEESVRDEIEVMRLSNNFEQFYAEFKETLQTKFEVYENRAAQEEMIREVEEALQQDKHLMIEAGTGTGKSLGYLIPAIYFGLKQDRKVVVSTHTINLQEQLRDRDIPLLQELFPAKFRAAVLKGRSHYLCLRKFEHKMNAQDFDNTKEDVLTAAQMIVWLGETGRGDEEELHLAQRGGSFWHSVASDTDSCLNRACPWFKKCFYHRARHEANIADLIITNHSLLFTDMKAENRLLPAYKHLVIDEAHHFEEVASKHLGVETPYFGFAGTLQRLYKDARSGQLPSLQFRLQQHDGDERAGAWLETAETLGTRAMEAREQWDVLCEKLYGIVSAASLDPSATETGQYVLRMKPESLPPVWNELLVQEDNLYLNVTEIVKPLEKLVGELKELQDEYEVQSLVTDLNGSLKDLIRYRDSLRFFMRMPDPEYVYWMEAGAYLKSRSLTLVSVPHDVSPLLQEHFFDTKDSIVLTSATLSVDKSFDYMREQLGLAASFEAENGPEKLKTVQLPSPFNYRKQALVVIPRDFPGIKGGTAGEAAFVAALLDSLYEVALVTKGRMLVLFTSSRMLKQVHGPLKERLQPHDIGVLGQGVDSGNRSKLLRQFQDSRASVLLGTSSFWEGVDIPGDALTCLAIVRLPFQPPNHPLAEAKSEIIKKSNQNPFMKLSVPQAVIRFKQGFGRLVRRASDRGTVIIYDTRVIETNYGKYFLYSLPGPKIEHMPAKQMTARIQQWLEMEGEPG
ncbi:ATP-dependent DNA helicase DinG [Gordoniibacillus kamchatkensis]|uniref:3'-5' exonuclease DinG n=1 Tax=Gordoniibacillus kamchatkensis TaxID=1590651 RepID=A0ABR5AG56_9BACL|nr:ATP-dependent DNA helicase DinG [Paenibacillus sp. VKM B-2647]KIL40031.1 ATP-dependent DNA helicase DinG [Paenibacillus sp. VKM B-2647]